MMAGKTCNGPRRCAAHHGWAAQRENFAIWAIKTARFRTKIAAARALFKVNGWRSKCLGRSNQARWARRCNRAWVDAAGIVAKNARLACWDCDGRAGRNDTCNVLATVLYPICQSDGATPQRNLHIICYYLAFYPCVHRPDDRGRPSPPATHDRASVCAVD